MILCTAGRAFSVRRLRQSRRTFLESVAASLFHRLLPPPLCSAPHFWRGSLRSCHGGPHHLHTTAPIKSVHVFRDAVDAVSSMAVGERALGFRPGPDSAPRVCWVLCCTFCSSTANTSLNWAPLQRSLIKFQDPTFGWLWK